MSRQRGEDTDDGESASMRNMNLAGNVVASGGRRRYMQNKETGRMTRINYEEGRRVV